MQIFPDHFRKRMIAIYGIIAIAEIFTILREFWLISTREAQILGRLQCDSN